MAGLFQQVIAFAVLVYLVSALVVRARWPWIPVWAIMALASFVVVVSGIVPIDQVGGVIDLNVVLFLIGMFSLVSLAESSGLLGYFTSIILYRVRDIGLLIYVAAFIFGFLSAIAVNDTIALMGPPIVYSIAKTTGVNPEAIYLLLAFSITIGSVTTPIGNPQNVLVAIQSGMNAPFIKFVEYLAIPTLINLYITAYLIKRIYRIGSLD